jgi:hypothetical protein
MNKGTTIFLTVVSVLGIYSAINAYLADQKKARAQSEIADVADAAATCPNTTTRVTDRVGCIGGSF